MVNLETEELNEQPIKKFEVWWRTPMGLHNSLDVARIIAESVGMPIYMIRAVPVALTEDGTYEELLGG